MADENLIEDALHKMHEEAVSNLQKENSELKKCIEECLTLCENISSEIKMGENGKWNLMDLDVEEIDKLLQMQFKVYNKWSTCASETVVEIRRELGDNK